MCAKRGNVKVHKKSTLVCLFSADSGLLTSSHSDFRVLVWGLRTCILTNFNKGTNWILVGIERTFLLIHDLWSKLVFFSFFFFF